MRGFISAHRKYGITLSPTSVFTYTTEQKGELPLLHAAKLLELPAMERPTGWVTYNDQLAVTLLDQVRAQGLSVPGDLSIVGFDDSFLATATEVKLTSVSHPKKQMGIQAADWMMAMIEGKQELSWQREYLYKPELIVRESTAVPAT